MTFFLPSVILCILNIVGAVPYIGVVATGMFAATIGLLLYYFVGDESARISIRRNSGKKSLYLLIAFLSTWTAMTASYVSAYFAYPLRVALKNWREPISYYNEALDKLQVYLNVGSHTDGVLAFALKSREIDVSHDGLKELLSSNISGTSAWDAVISVINIILNGIPMLLSWLLSANLQLVSNTGAIGIAYWYLIATAFTWLGFRFREK